MVYVGVMHCDEVVSDVMLLSEKIVIFRCLFCMILNPDYYAGYKLCLVNVSSRNTPNFMFAENV